MILNPTPYTVLRYARELVDHVIVEREAEELTVYGNLQPMSSREIRNAPEGFRRMPGKKWKFYTTEAVELKIGGIDPGEMDDLAPDRIVVGARLLFVHGLTDWANGLIPHRKWLCVEPETEVGAENPYA